MRSYETNGVIKDNVLSIRNRKLFDKALSTFGDCEVEIKVVKKSRKRTSPQNRYYWGVIVFYWSQILTQEYGEQYTDKMTHEELKANLNYTDMVNKETGECWRKMKSTTENKTFEMEEYHKRCRDVALQMYNVTIPLPNEQLEVF